MFLKLHYKTAATASRKNVAEKIIVKLLGGPILYEVNQKGFDDVFTIIDNPLLSFKKSLTTVTYYHCCDTYTHGPQYVTYKCM